MKAAAVLCTFLFAAAWAFPKGLDDPQYKRLFVDSLLKDLPEELVPRIVNGIEAAPHSIPYQAYLIITARDGSRWLCGGSLISSRHVITAGHCVDDSILAEVYLGAHNLQQTEATRILVISTNLTRHSDYNEQRISDDIGLITFDSPVQLNSNVNVIALPSRDRVSDYVGDNVRVSGWGLVSGTGSTSPVLLEVNSTVISNAQCRQIFNIVIDSQICISGTGGVGACSGDSGGPLVYQNTLIGIVSYGATNCPAGYPSAFTRVTSFLSWIQQHTGL